MTTSATTTIALAIIASGVLVAMAIRSSTQAILDRIAALQADDQAEIDAAVAAAVAERDAAIAADAAEDQEQVDAINAALDGSALTPNADEAGGTAQEQTAA